MKPNKYAPMILDRIRVERRGLGASSPRAFAQLYLTTQCCKPFSRMHDELFELLAGMIAKRDARLAVAAPRGHAKSTIVSLAFVLWCVLYQKEKFILIVCATSDQADSLLKDIKDELRQNPLLLQDFPEVYAQKASPWRKSRVQLPNGAMIRACGAGQGIRGTKHGANRPGLIVVDDLEDPEGVISQEQREKLRDWFTGTLMHTGRPGTNIVVVGTVLHHDSLLSNLTKANGSPGWTRRRYKALINYSDHPNLWETWSAIFRDREDYEEKSGPEAADVYFAAHRKDMLAGTKALWPQHEDYHALMVMREREGQASFQSEKQNEPIDPELCVFSEEKMHFWDDEFDDVNALVESFGGKGVFYGACDPSLGRRTRRGDYTAIVILFQPEDSRTNYVIAADLARRKPDDTIQRIIQFARMYSFRDFAVESNQFQEVMVSNLTRSAKEAGVSLSLIPLKNSSNKVKRIEALEPEVTQGIIRFCRRHSLLLDQMRQFPFAGHDDGPDALEMAMTLARQPQRSKGTKNMWLEVW